MAAKSLMPKLVPLTVKQTPLEVENFWSNLKFQLSTQPKFVPLIEATWDTVAEDQDRGFEDTSEETASQQRLTLNFMLGTIASYVPIISRRFITEQATSLEEIWRRLKVFYGFQRTGGNILKLSNHCIKSGQSYESYWEDIYGIFEDSLLKSEDELEHLGEVVQDDEPLTPTLLALAVMHWLHGINNALPEFVLLRYTRELKKCTLYTIREDISSNIPSLLRELNVSEDAASVAKISAYPRSGPSSGSATHSQSGRLCFACDGRKGRRADHFFQRCPHMPQNDKRFMQTLYDAAKTGGRVSMLEVEEQQSRPEMAEDAASVEPLIARVAIASSPTLPVYYKDEEVSILLDYGAEANLASVRAIQRLNIPMHQTSQGARQADGSTPLAVLGESHVQFRFNHHALNFSCLVVENLPVEFLGGVPFHTSNDIYARTNKRTIYVGECCQYKYPTVRRPDGAIPVSLTLTDASVAVPAVSVSTQEPREAPVPKPLAKVLRIECQTTVLPGGEVKCEVPSIFRHEEYVTIEPRTQAKSMLHQKTPWLQPTIQTVDNEGCITLRNSSKDPIKLSRHEQVCNVRVTQEMETSPTDRRSVNPTSARPTPPLAPGSYFSDSVQIDPGKQLSVTDRNDFVDIIREEDDTFSPKIGLYNGASGPFMAVVNMGETLPPQRKGRSPQYSNSDNQALQAKFDDFGDDGVFATPESVGVTVVNLNPSFLVKKFDDKGQVRGHRLVTNFGEVAQYSKPQPSLLPNVNDTLRAIGKWRYLVKMDLKEAYFQIPLSPESMKFCGVCTPFKGIRVYTRCAMGMPGSETALEELMSRILGPLIMKGVVAKIADDLYCGGSLVDEVKSTFKQVLRLLSLNGLRLSPSKTVICPTSTSILGWLWNNGTLTASPHRISALEVCSPPSTVFGLRSFLGAYKFLGRVMPNYCDVLHPLEAATAGRDTKESISWTGGLTAAFENAQKHLTKAKTITIPRPDDEIRIITDASISKLGLAATMFVIRDGKPRLAGFFNAKLRPHQTRWLPCEIEALCIGSAVKHFSPYIVQSKHAASVLTDSRPCVQAYQKLCRGQFSSSARVMTFLSILSNYGIRISHIKGSDNLTADFASRHPVECEEKSCQICKFVEQLDESVVRAVTVGDVTSVDSIELFTNRKAWLDIQRACPTLNRVHAHLRQGSRPLKKARSPLIKDVRRYLNNGVRIAADGLLVVPATGEFTATRDRIVVPRPVVHGIATAIHLKLLHPSKYQLTKVMERQFFAINMVGVIEKVHENCDACTAIQKVPTKFKAQSTSTPDDVIGTAYSADVIRRCRQMIMIVRENISAYTQACLITDETGASLRDALLGLLATFRSSRGRSISVRVDPAPGFCSIVNDPLLKQQGIALEIGRAKNVNKNPIAEHAVQEIHAQIVRLQPQGGSISSTTLALAVSNANSEIRNCGLSASEIWTQRDQYSSQQLPVSDRTIIVQRYQQRLDSHKPSAKFKSRGKLTTNCHDPPLNTGDLVYLVNDRDKTKARNRYIITGMDENRLKIRKFIGGQLRSQTYTVDCDDCLLIKSSVIGQPLLENSYDSDTDSDDDQVQDGHPRRDGEEIQDGGTQADDALEASETEEEDALSAPAERDVSPAEPAVTPPHRGGRRRRIQPAWIRGGEFETEFTDSDSD